MKENHPMYTNPKRQGRIKLRDREGKIRPMNTVKVKVKDQEETRKKTSNYQEDSSIFLIII